MDKWYLEICKYIIVNFFDVTAIVTLALFVYLILSILFSCHNETTP